MPGVGEVDMTSATGIGQVLVGITGGLALAGLGATAFNAIKSRTGVDDVKSAMPEV